jgi:pyruvate,water dikinase
VLSEPDPTAVKEGDIIVMEYADPGWTPLFPQASGIVMEVGGLMCHAAVVARELGIPAVFGIPNATAILENGQHVKVDGVKGTVTLETVGK